MGRLAQRLTSSEGTALSRLATLAIPFLIAALAWYFTNANQATKDSLDAVQSANFAISTQLANLSIQIARLEEQVTGGRNAQAIIDANQNERLNDLARRTERLEEMVPGG